MGSKAAPFVVIAEFEVPTEHRTEFLELCAFDSLRSTTDEAGCRQFDVNTSDEAPQVVILYEVYDDRAAFDKHLTTPHYDVFAAGLAKFGVTKTLARFLNREHSGA
jgi:autoinducer 2-degrading protein